MVGVDGFVVIIYRGSYRFSIRVRIEISSFSMEYFSLFGVFE